MNQDILLQSLYFTHTNDFLSRTSFHKFEDLQLYNSCTFVQKCTTKAGIHKNSLKRVSVFFVMIGIKIIMNIRIANATSEWLSFSVVLC